MPFIFVIPRTPAGFPTGSKDLHAWMNSRYVDWDAEYTTIEPLTLMRWARVGYTYEPLTQNFTVHHVFEYNKVVNPAATTARWWQSPVHKYRDANSNDDQPEVIAYGFQFRSIDYVPGDIRIPGVLIYRGLTIADDELYRDMTRLHDKGDAHFPYIGTIWKNIPTQDVVDKILAANVQRYERSLIRSHEQYLLHKARRRRDKMLQRRREEADYDDDDDEPDVAPSSGGQNGIPEDPDLDAKMALLDDALDALGGAKGRYKRKSKKVAPKPKGKKKRVVKPKKKRIAKRKK